MDGPLVGLKGSPLNWPRFAGSSPGPASRLPSHPLRRAGRRGAPSVPGSERVSHLMSGRIGASGRSAGFAGGVAGSNPGGMADPRRACRAWPLERSGRGCRPPPPLHPSVAPPASPRSGILHRGSALLYVPSLSSNRPYPMAGALPPFAAGNRGTPPFAPQQHAFPSPPSRDRNWPPHPLALGIHPVGLGTQGVLRCYAARCSI